MKTFWKAAYPDGWDLYTHKTINYRKNVGKTVTIALKNRRLKAELCTPSVLHATFLPNNVFVSAKIPMSLYEVAGKSVVADDTKCGFRKLKILREIPQDEISKILGWNYAETCNPINPLKITHREIMPEIIEAMKYWAQVGAQVWAQVRAQVWAQVRAQVRAQVGDQVRAQVWGYISSLFPKKISPFCDVLWRAGLVWTNYDGIWYLHGGPDAKIVWQGKLEELKVHA